MNKEIDQMYEVAEEIQTKLNLLMGLLRAARMDKEKQERVEKQMRLNKVESEVNREREIH